MYKNSFNFEYQNTLLLEQEKICIDEFQVEETGSKHCHHWWFSMQSHHKTQIFKSLYSAFKNCWILCIIPPAFSVQDDCSSLRSRLVLKKKDGRSHNRCPLSSYQDNKVVPRISYKTLLKHYGLELNHEASILHHRNSQGSIVGYFSDSEFKGRKEGGVGNGSNKVPTQKGLGLGLVTWSLPCIK